MLNQNPPQFTCDCTTHLTHIPQSRPFSTKQNIVHIKTTHLISSKTTFDQSSSFKSPTSSISTYLHKVPPKLSRGPVFGRIHSVYISSWFMIRLDLFPAKLQLAVKSSSWKNSLSLCLDKVYDKTLSTPLQLTVGHDVIHLRSSRCN